MASFTALDRRREIYSVGVTDVTENLVLFKGAPKPIGRDAEDDAPEAVCTNVNRRAKRIVTNGNGACALHSVFGKPDARKELFCENARDIMWHYLQRPWSEVEGHLSQNLAKAIQSKLWTDFLLPVVRGDAVIDEQKIFSDLL